MSQVHSWKWSGNMPFMSMFIRVAIIKVVNKTKLPKFNEKKSHLLTDYIQSERHRHFRFGIHLALIHSTVTCLREFHLQRPILRVIGSYDL